MPRWQPATRRTLKSLRFASSIRGLPNLIKRRITPIELMQRAKEQLFGCDFTAEFTLLRTQYEARNLCIVDILNAGCSKGHALERWANYRGIDRSEVMAIGDNYNDIEMLTFAGHPVIMGNASDDLKQNGWTVTLHNDESGVAAAIEQVLDTSQ